MIVLLQYVQESLGLFMSNRIKIKKSSDKNGDEIMNKKNELYWGDKERIKRNEEIRKKFKNMEVK